MTATEKRIAIAKACDYYLIQSENSAHTFRLCDGNNPNIRFGWCDSEEEAWDHCPDYLNDLNAMHEAEKMLKGSKDDEYCELSEYYENICLVCGDGMEPLNVHDIDLVRSTAHQRADAFLKTIGKL